MNVLEDPAGRAELQALGAQSVPVLARGKAFTFAQSRRQIVDFLGLTETTEPLLAPDELARRLDSFMAAALRLIPLMPAALLGMHVPGRPRSYRVLAYHLFRVVDAYVGATQGVTLQTAMFSEEPAPDADTAALTVYGDGVRQRFAVWRRGGDTAPDRILQTSYGPQRLHELLERTTWHCGQHVRQWMMLLDMAGVAHDRPLGDVDFADLPMPKNVWDG